MKRSSQTCLFLFTVILAAACFLVPNRTWAGCCQIPSPSGVTYENLNHEQCTARNAAYAGSNFQYEDKKIASAGGCAEKKTTLPLVQEEKSEPLLPQLQVSIPGFKGFTPVVCDEEHPECSTPWLAEYIRGIYNYSLLIISILSTIVLMIGGIIWLTAGGNRGQIGTAMGLIKGGVLGAVLAFASYLILFLLNPNLTVLRPLNVSYIAREDLPDISEYQQIIDNNGKLPDPVPTAMLPLGSAKGNIINVEIETVGGKRTVQVDSSIAEMTKKAFKEVKEAGFKVYEAGGYRPSKMCHGLGLAIDINVKDNYCIDCYKVKYARVPDPTDKQKETGREADAGWYRPPGPGDKVDYTKSATSLPPEIVNIFKKNGFCWGGDWRSFKDYMHISTPSCRKGVECGAPGLYNFNQSVRKNHSNLGITYP